MGRFSAAALVLLALPLAAPAQDPVFRSDVSLVRLLVTVKDSAGGLVTNANRDDFTIFDNGVRQPISIFERRTEQPLSVSLLIDTSGSTGIELHNEVDSILHFVTALFHEGNPADCAALYSFDTDVTLRSSFTRRIPRLEHELQSLKSEAGTSMYDAIWLASGDFEEREGRHIIVIVTDGGDTTSAKDFNAALEAAQRAEASVYPVVIIPVSNDAGRNTGGEHALATIAQRTGGRIFLPSNGAELEAAFVDLVHELRTQYMLGYYPKNIPPSTNRFHTTTVHLARPGLRAITRSGYYGTTDR